MSRVREQTSGRAPHIHSRSALVALLWFACGIAHADGAIDAWARWAVTPKVWKGQTVRAPDPEPRPEARSVRVDAVGLPLHVHMPVPATDLHRAAVRALHQLRALEAAFSTWHELGWPGVPFDGGQGGDIGFDLYVVPHERCADACSGSDGLDPLRDFDAAQTYALLAADLPDSSVDACTLRAVAQAALRAQDPAEAESWVRASAELLTWQYGPAACDSQQADHAQGSPELGLLNADPASANAGVLWLAVESERLGHEPAAFVRSLWESTRQRSKDLVPPDRLRGSPDLWEVLRQMLLAQHRQLDDELIEFGVARYFTGPDARRAQASYRSLAALPDTASVPLARELRSGQLPSHIRDTPALRELGSAYVRVQLAEPHPPEQLKLWLHGELGPRWSLTAVRLDAAGREAGRVSTPARSLPSSYLPVALSAETRTVLVVVTLLPRLPTDVPDADVRNDTRHGFELIVAAE